MAVRVRFFLLALKDRKLEKSSSGSRFRRRPTAASRLPFGCHGSSNGRRMALGLLVVGTTHMTSTSPERARSSACACPVVDGEVVYSLLGELWNICGCGVRTMEVVAIRR